MRIFGNRFLVYNRIKMYKMNSIVTPKALKSSLSKQINKQKEYVDDIEALSLESKNEHGFYLHGQLVSHFHVQNEKLKLASLKKKREALN